MYKTKFLSGNNANDIYDPELLVHQLLKNDVEKYLRTRKKKLNSSIFNIIFFAVFFIIGFNQTGEEGTPYFFISGVFLISTIYFLISFTKIQPSKRVNKIGLACIPISHLKFQNKSILVDRSKIIPSSIFEYSSIDSESINQIDTLIKDFRKEVSNFPIILSGGDTRDLEKIKPNTHIENLKLFREEKKISEKLELITEKYLKYRKFEKKIPAFNKNPELLEFLKQLPTEQSFVKLERLELNDLKNHLNEIDGVVNDYLSDSEKRVDIDDLSVEALKLINSAVQKMDYSIDQSINETAKPASFLFSNILKSNMFNQYCPYCNNEAINRLEEGKYFHEGNKDYRLKTIQNTKMVLVDLVNNIWQCPLCEKETAEPYERHKLEDELFTPAYDLLYEEHYKDRLAIYNDIINQKLKYSERAETELESVFRENRSKGEAAKSKIRSSISTIRGGEEAIKELKNILVKYERIKMDIAREIEEDTRRIREEVARDVEKSKKIIEDTFRNAQNNISQCTEKYANLEREDQSKRDEIQKQQLKEQKESNNQLAECNRHLEKTREIQEVHAERDGMNKRRWFGLGSSERGRVSDKRM